MTERADAGPAAPSEPSVGFDREIDSREIFKIGIWLIALCVASFAIVWGLYHGLVAAEEKSDRRPGPIAGTVPGALPPVPRLQGIERDQVGRPFTAEKELLAIRAAENARLASWGWVDEAAGIAHIPIGRAMELTVARGDRPPAVAAKANGTP